MIKITSVEIDGFIAPSQKVKLDFVESNIVCIYGDNGSGKTTFLEILFAVFDRNEKLLFDYKVNKIKIDYTLNTTLESVFIGLDIDEYGNDCYNFDSLDDSDFKEISSLFLGIGRGIHKKKLDIPRQTLWHFFRTNKKISEDKILTGNEIDDFTDKLVNHLDDVNLIESDKAKELDNKKNIYLPNIEIDTIEAFLMNKYKEAVLDAKERIEKSVAKTSLKFSKDTNEKKIDFQELKKKLLYNKLLLLEMFDSDDNMGIAPLFKNLEENEKFLEEIEFFQQRVLLDVVRELQSEVELFKEIQVFIDEYNSFLNYDKKLVINSNGVFVSPENHSLQRLSSGERHLLTFLATILLMGEEQDFILIDEPEISLNVDWQRGILSTIAKLAPNSQIIVATHSPLIGRSYRKSVVGLEPKVIDYEE